MKTTRHIRLAWSVSAAVIALGTAALLAATFTAQTPLVERFDGEAYNAALARHVASVADIAADYECQQLLVLPIAPPDPDIPLTMPGGTLPIEPKGFSDAFLVGLIPAMRNGVVVYPITVYEDPLTQARVILNAAGQELARVAAPVDYDPLWYVEAHTPGLATMEPASADWYTGIYDPSRIEIAYDLILEDALVQQVWQMSLLSDEIPPPPDGECDDCEGEGTNAPLSDWSGVVSNLQFVQIGRMETNLLLRLTLAYPEGFTNRISVITDTNLVVPNWTLFFTTNTSPSTNAVIFFDANFTTNNEQRFYYAYNADHDSDGDGVSDGAERFLFGSATNNMDTDGDGMGDAAELAYGFTPIVSNVYRTLPYTETFESRTNGVLNGQDGWACLPTNMVTVQTNDVYGGSKAAEFLTSTNPPTAEHFFAAHGVTNVWVDFRAKVDPRSVTYSNDHPNIVNAPAYEPSVFAVNRRGEVWAYNGATGAWSTDTRFKIEDYRWSRFTVKQDYTAQTWDLFVDSIRVFQGLGMRNWFNPVDGRFAKVTEFSRFTVAAARGGGWYVDDTSIATNQPSWLYGTLQTHTNAIATGNDDAMEDNWGGSQGAMDRNSADLDLAKDMVGLRFTALPIATGALVRTASVQFTADNQTDGVDYCLLRIQCHRTNDAPVFTSANNDISSRQTTQRDTQWAPAGWEPWQANWRQRTPDLASLFGEITALSGWQSGNDVVVIVRRLSGNDARQMREASSYDRGASYAAVLRIEWALPLP